MNVSQGHPLKGTKSSGTLVVVANVVQNPGKKRSHSFAGKQKEVNNQRVRCEVCNNDYSHRYIEKHKKTKMHLKNEKEAKILKVKDEESENDLEVETEPEDN